MQTRNIRSFVYTALFAALFIAMNMVAIRLSISPVPITLQTLAVMLAGIFLTPRNAFFSIFIVILLSALGLPLFNGNGGLSYLFGVTGGFIISFPIGAWLISVTMGKLLRSSSFAKRGTLSFIVLFVIVEAISMLAYVPGIPWMMKVLDISFAKALAVGYYPFIIGDILKALAASSVTMALLPYIKRVRATMKDNHPVRMEPASHNNL